MQRAYIIAEMACSHEGNLRIAEEIIRAAGVSGADAIQFQIWSLDHYVVRHHPDYGKLASLEFTPDEWEHLYKYSRSRFPDLEIIGCVSELKSLAFADQLGVNAFKIHAGDIQNLDFLKAVSLKNRRIDLSVGACTLEEIREALGVILANNSQVWLMAGHQSFPTPIDDAALNFLRTIRSEFQLPVGYQDHSAGDSTAGFWLPAATMGMGVYIQEKHLTHNRSAKGIDYEAALNPNEFSIFVKMIRSLERLLEEPVQLALSPAQVRYRRYCRKSLVARQDIEAGSSLSSDDVVALRAPELGMPPALASSLNGRVTSVPISKHQLIREEDFQ